MRGLKHISLLASALLCLSGAQAQDAIEWGEVEGWLIAVDTTINDSCFAITSFEDGTVLRIGFDASEQDLPYYVMLGNPAWESIEMGKDYDLELQLDSQAPWTATARGIQMSDVTVLYLGGADITFLDEFTRKHQLIVRYRGSEIARLSLSGSYRATAAMVQCQMEQQGRPAPGNDPFSAPSQSPVRDPFAA